MKTFTKKSGGFIPLETEGRCEPSRFLTGFTLVEIMVAVSIFVVVAMIATGALITASDINRKAQAIKLAVDNVNFALNKMAFEMKLGGIYRCENPATLIDYNSIGINCSGGSESITFMTYRDDCASLPSRDMIYCNLSSNKIPVAYKLVTVSGHGEIQYSFNNDNPNTGPWMAVTSPEVNIIKLNFIVGGSNNVYSDPGNDGTTVPRVSIELTGIVADGTKYKTEFDIRTFAVNRGN
ncbi:MAG: type II secretion system protein [Patescibacteria group bacterium]